LTHILFGVRSEKRIKLGRTEKPKKKRRKPTYRKENAVGGGGRCSLGDKKTSREGAVNQYERKKKKKSGNCRRLDCSLFREGNLIGRGYSTRRLNKGNQACKTLFKSKSHGGGSA